MHIVQIYDKKQQQRRDKDDNKKLGFYGEFNIFHFMTAWSQFTVYTDYIGISIKSIIHSTLIDKNRRDPPEPCLFQNVSKISCAWECK